MQHPGIHVAEHAVAQAVAVQQGAKLNDIIRQVLRGNAGIFGKRNRLRRPFGIAEQPHGFFPHRVDTLDTGQIVTELPADHAAFAMGNQFVQSLTQRGHLAVDKRCVVAGKFHDIKTQHLFTRHVGNQLANGVPDDIFPGQIEHFRVNGFH